MTEFMIYDQHRVYEDSLRLWKVLRTSEGAVPLLEGLPLVEFMYTVFTRMPGGVTLGDSGFCCCVPCLISTVHPFVC